jgi:hypothetical protein
LPSQLLEAIPPKVVLLDASVNRISICGTKHRVAGSGGFDFDVDLSEVSRSKDVLEVEYTFRFGRKSEGNSCEIGGRAKLRLVAAGAGADMEALGPEVTNEIVVGIFRRNYESVYLIHQSMGMEAPSPWITQDVSLARRSDGGPAAD